MRPEIDPIVRGHLERGIEGLVDEFRGVFSRETIERYVRESLESLRDEIDRRVTELLKSLSSDPVASAQFS